jgi:hypothetical protein
MIESDTLEIEFKFGRLDSGKIMKVCLTHGSTIIDLVPDNNNKSIATCLVSLPDCVTISFSGKDLEHDTKLDEHGNIIMDLFVQIESLTLSGFKIPKELFYYIFVLHTVDGKQTNGAYIGFNGKIELALSQASLFSQIMHWKNSHRLTQNS